MRKSTGWFETNGMIISRKRSGIWIMLNRTALKGDLEHMRGRGGRGLALKLEMNILLGGLVPIRELGFRTRIKSIYY
jgi:hypothetical protein